MNKITDDCFSYPDALLPAAEALALLGEHVQAISDSETVPLAGAAGRVLAQDLEASIQVPMADNSAVDGYALRHADLNAAGETQLSLGGRVAAGHAMGGELAPGAVARIFTGAAMPTGADTVVMQEDVALRENIVIIPPGLKPGANRRLAGEDTKIGDLVLHRGRRLRAQDLALAASLGRAELSVFRQPRVALLSTGDELREPGDELPIGGVYDANRYMLRCLLTQLGAKVDDLGILPDQPEKIRDALADAMTWADLIITSGGMSVGEEDHIKAVIEELGSLHFWRIAVKPGRPLAIGHLGNALFVGLPGNPVAVMVCFVKFTRPLLLRLAGANAAEWTPTSYPLPALFDYDKKTGRREFLRASLVLGEAGRMRVQKFPAQGSGIIRSLVDSDGLIELPEDLASVRQGDLVEFLPLGELTR